MTVKMQHYVPQFYLRNFSNQQGEKYIIYCFDKLEDKEFSTDVGNIGGEKYFYDIKKGEEQFLEKKLSELEPKFNKSIQNLIKYKKIDNISEYQRGILSFFIAVQYLRTKENREIIRDGIDQILERLSKYKLSESLKKELDDIDSGESIKSMHIQNLVTESKEFVDIIFNMKWILYINKTDMPFYTSDNPVKPHNDLDRGPYGNLGLLSIGIQLHIPISPELCLIACDPTSYDHHPAKYEITNKENIKFENGLQVFSSTRHIFSIDNDFSLAKEIIKKNPWHKDPNRKRMHVK